MHSICWVFSKTFMSGCFAAQAPSHNIKLSPPKNARGRPRSLLRQAALNGCVNDVKAIREVLLKHKVCNTSPGVSASYPYPCVLLARVTTSHACRVWWS